MRHSGGNLCGLGRRYRRPTHVYNNKTERQTIEMLSQRLLTRACVPRMRLALLNCPAAQRRRIGAKIAGWRRRRRHTRAPEVRLAQQQEQRHLSATAWPECLRAKPHDLRMSSRARVSGEPGGPAHPHDDHVARVACCVWLACSAPQSAVGQEQVVVAQPDN